jgi:hypothetical protein
MSSIEDQLRAASRETAREVSPDSVPPLRLPPASTRYNSAGQQRAGSAGSLAGRPGSSRARIGRRLAPVAAAAAVLVIAIAATVVASLARTTPQPRHGPAAPPGHVPRYYVALELVQPHVQEGPTRAVVTSTATGAVLATISVPKPYATFAGVVAAADDRTFVIRARMAPSPSAASTALPASRFFRLTIDPAAPVLAERAHLAALPVPPEPRGTLAWFALSPDGSRLAVSSTRWVQAKVGHPQLSVFDLRTASRRTWNIPPGFGTSLIWLADSRTLALAGAPVRDYRWQVLLLDTTAPGASFAADARVAARISSSPRLIWRQLMITPDGRTLLVVRETPRPSGWPITGTARLQRYDVRTRKMTGVVDTRKVRLGEYDELQWSSRSGQVLITLLPRHKEQTGPGVNTERTAAIIVGHRLYPIPWSRTAIEGAW